MQLICKQFLLIIIIFIITLWFQNTDDKKHKINRITFYEKYKIPIFFGAITGLFLNILNVFNDDLINHHNDQSMQLYDQEIYIEPLLYDQ